VSAAFPALVMLSVPVAFCPMVTLPNTRFPLNAIIRVVDVGVGVGVVVVGEDEDPPQAKTNSPRTKVARTRFNHGRPLDNVFTEELPLWKPDLRPDRSLLALAQQYHTQLARGVWRCKLCDCRTLNEAMSRLVTPLGRVLEGFAKRNSKTPFPPLRKSEAMAEAQNLKGGGYYWQGRVVTLAVRQPIEIPLSTACQMKPTVELAGSSTG
jgi:hypothetical protein